MSEMSVPEGWKVKRLGSNIDILSGFPFKSSEFTNNPSDFGLIRIRDLQNQRLETFYRGDFSDEFIVKRGDILIGMDGDFNIVKWKSQRALLNQRICKIMQKDGGFDVNFVHYVLIPELQQIHNQTTATTVKHLSVKDIREIEKPFPPLPEQQKIASILTSVDEVIEKTQAQINKLQDLKKATMNELLTRGIGHTAFKDSPVGKIPREWEIKCCEDVCEKIIVGIVVKPSQYYEDSGIPVLRSANIKEMSIFGTNLKYISSESNELLKKSKLSMGDVLTVRTGYPGTTSVVSKEFVGGNCVDLIISRPSKLVNSEFLAIWINSDEGKGQVLRNQGGLAQQHFNVGDMKGLVLPVPCISEQEKIVSVLTSLNHLIQNKQRKLTQTQSLKKALMQDLLTGKVRVSV